MPNIEGQLTTRPNSINGADGGVFSAKYGAFSSSAMGVAGNTNKVSVVSNAIAGDRINFDASNSNSIYGNSTTVQPPAVKLLPCIKAYSDVDNLGTLDVAQLENYVQNNVVHTSGDETISGSKLLTNNLRIRTTDNSYETLHLGTITGGARISSETFSASTTGARMELYGRTAPAPTTAGLFNIIAKNTSNATSLVGYPNGTLTWNGQNIQTSSDERIKTTLSDVPDEILDSWDDVRWGEFKYLEAVEEKGENARYHIGLIAQSVDRVFKNHSEDILKYGILCHDEREATEDEEAVDLWMVRYTEALCMEAAYQRRENRRLKEKVASLEERLASLESKLGLN